MSINGCTINVITSNDLCRRGVILAALPPWVPTPTPSGGKPHQQHVNPDTSVDLNIFRRDRRHTDPLEEDQIDVTKVEQPIITVSVELNGETFTQSRERVDTSLRPMINVYGVAVGSSIAETISVLDVKVDGKSIAESVNIFDIKLRVLT